MYKGKEDHTNGERNRQHSCHNTNNQVLKRSNGLSPRQDFGLRCAILVVFVQSDPKVSVHLMITVQKTIPTQLMI
jgi:hypothetical protein